MQYMLCRHIRTNGLQCQAPSLTEGIYCFFHNRLHQRHSAYRLTPETRGYLLPGHHLQLTALEDRESVQVALSVVINALATGQIETRRATALLYGLQLASANTARLHTQPSSADVVRSAESTPDGLDLAEPGATKSYASYPDDPDDEDDPDDPGDEDDEDDEELDDRRRPIETNRSKLLFARRLTFGSFHQSPPFAPVLRHKRY